MSLKMRYGGGRAAGAGVRVDTVTLDDQTVASGSYALLTLNAGASGTPIGVAGYSIDNATTDGGRCSFCSVYACYVSGTDVIFNIRNHHSSTAAKIKVSVDVLYV